MVMENIQRVQDAEVVINNVRFPVDGGITWELVNNFGRRFQQGDPEPNDHAVDSTITQQSHQGGIGTRVYRGDDDRGNCWFSTCWMQTSRALTLRPKTFVTSGVDFGEEGEIAFPHERLGGVFYASIGTTILRWNESTDQWVDTTDATTATPVDSGIVWGDEPGNRKLYIPLGDNGYDTYDGTTIVNAATADDEAEMFGTWDQKLFRVDRHGQVWSTADGASWTKTGIISDDSDPGKFYPWYNRANQPRMFLSTTSSTWAVDYENTSLVQTLKFPENPRQGIGADQWRGDAYISVGVGVHRDSNGLVQAVGPDGRDGLPERYANGAGTDLHGGYNELYFSVRGIDIADEGIVETADAGFNVPDTLYTNGYDQYGLLLGWNGLGWHPRHESRESPTRIKTASISGVYRLFWGGHGYLYTQQLPIGYYNPNYESARIPLERRGYHITPFYNWGFVDTTKILKYLEVKTTGCSADDYIDVYYQTENSENDELGPDWTYMGRLDTNGQHRLLTGYEDYNGTMLHVGLPHERVRFYFDFFGNVDSDYSTPNLEWYTLVGRKWNKALRVWNMTLDCTAPYNNLTERQLDRAIVAAARKQGAVPMVIGDQTFMVDVTSDDGGLEAGMTFKGWHQITAIETLESELD